MVLDLNANELDGSQSLVRVAREYASESSFDLDDAMKDDGILESVNEEIKAEQKPQAAPSSTPQPTEGQQATSVGGAATGVGQGIADISQSVLNFVRPALDGLENFAVKHGVGTGDLFDNKFDYASKLGSPDDSFVTKASRAITKMGAPVAVGAGIGSFLGPMGTLAGVGVGMAVNAAYNFVASDPDAERFSNLLRDELPSLKNFPVAYKAIDYLAKKPGETELESRTKNMLEGMGLDAALGGTFYAMAKTAGYLKGSKGAVKAAINAGASQEEVLTQVVQQAQKQATSVVEEAVEKLPHAIEDFSPPSVKDGVVKANLNNTDMVNFLHDFRIANPMAMEEVTKAARSQDELTQQAHALINSSGGKESFLSWRVASGKPLSPVETRAAHIMQRGVYEDLAEKAIATSKDPSPENLANLSQAKDSFAYITGIETGSGSVNAETLNAMKLGADLNEISVEDFIKQMSQKGRTDMAVDIVNASGGKENILDFAKAIAATKEISDEAFVDILNESSKLKPAEVKDYVISTMNSSLLGMATVKTNWISNILQGAGAIADNYTAAAIGMMRNADKRVSVQQANSFAKAFYTYQGKAWVAAKNAILKGRAGNIESSVKMANYMDPSLGKEVDLGQGLAKKISGKVIETYGMLGSIPSRLNATSDAYTSTLAYGAKATQIIVEQGEQMIAQGKPAAEVAKFVEKRLNAIPVAVHKDAKEFSRKLVFASPIPPGGFASDIQGAIEKVPMGIGKVVFPFFNTTYNLIRETAERSPLVLANSEVRRKIMSGGIEGDLAAAKVINGGALLGLATWLGYEGITSGMTDKDFTTGKALNEAGRGIKPNHIGQSVSFDNLGPVSAIMKLGWLAGNVHNYLKNDDMNDFAIQSMMAVAESFTPEQLVDTAGSLFEAVQVISNKDGKGADEGRKILVDLATRLMPAGRMIGEVESTVDPTRRSTTGAQGSTAIERFVNEVGRRYMEKIPGLSSTLPPTVNMFGEPIQIPPGLVPNEIHSFFSPNKENSDLVGMLKYLTDYQQMWGKIEEGMKTLDVSNPRPIWNYEGVTIPLNPQQYYRYQMYSAGLNEKGEKLGGASLRETLDVIAKQFSKDLVDSTKQEGIEVAKYNEYVTEITHAVQMFRNDVAQPMMLLDKDIMDKWSAAAKAGTETRQVDISSGRLTDDDIYSEED